MSKSSVAIIGYGNIGKALHRCFKDAFIYDVKGRHSTHANKTRANSASHIFICVPTPMREDGSCDTSYVEEALMAVTNKSALVIIRSTVSIGFTHKMNQKYAFDVVFMPEYFGMSTDHPYRELERREFLTFGGEPHARTRAIGLWQSVVNANVKIYQADAKTIELAKYMENSFLALKVTFCNEIYDIASALGIDYNTLREVFLADTRMSRSHTFVYEDARGYGGACLPKDLSALVFMARRLGVDVGLLEATMRKNKEVYGGE